MIERPYRWPAAPLPLDSPERWELVRDLYHVVRSKELAEQSQSRAYALDAMQDAECACAEYEH